ncbi:MAG: hypothetical protein ACI9PP_000945, partial [Halobacteriales archaeon]
RAVIPASPAAVTKSRRLGFRTMVQVLTPKY